MRRSPRVWVQRHSPTGSGRRILEADRDNENEERTRRLESDAQAVQVITVHRSKGLEFPVVLVPYAWDGWAFPIDVPVFHDPDSTNERTIDVGCPGPDSDDPQEVAGGRGARREPSSALCRPDPRPPPGGAVVGRSQGHEELFPVAAPLRSRARRPHPGEREAGAARLGRRVCVHRAGRRGLGRARRAAAGHQVAPRPREPVRARGRRLRPRPRHELAACLVLVDHQCSARAAGYRQ